MKILQKKNIYYWLRLLACMILLIMGSSLQAQVKKSGKKAKTTTKSTVKPAASSAAATDSVGAGRIQIIHADRTGYKKFSDTSMIRFASGHVAVRQSNTLFYCDSVAANPETQITEAYGHVHINDHDSIQIYADFMRYRGAERTAFLKNNVKLSDGNGTLTTSALDYDMNTKIAVYSQEGTLVNGNTVLTSQSGTYYGDTKDAQFTKDVKLVDPDYVMTTDTLLYNTVTRVATFTVPTLIKQGPYKSVQTTDGYYDLIHKTAYLGKRPTIIDSTSILVADEVAADDSSGYAEARGTVVFKDTAQGMVVLCNDLKSSRENASFLATVNPLAILKQETDSIFIAADTLYSARYSNDSLHLKDSTGHKGESHKDADRKDPDTGQPLVDTAGVAAADSTALPGGRFLTDHVPTQADTLPGHRVRPADSSSADGVPKVKSPGYHKVGNIFVWDQDTTKPAADSAKTAAPVPSDNEHKRLFDFFKSKKKTGKEAAVKAEQAATVAVPPSAAAADSTKPAAPPPGPGMRPPGKLPPGAKPAEHKKEQKKSIFNIFKKKEPENVVNAGKNQPTIIDSLKAAKPQPAADSLGSGKPGLNFSVDRSATSKKDTLAPEDKKNRFLEAYFNVRIYSDSLQGIGDSMYYSGRDSLIELFKSPTIWTTSNHQISQVSGDTIVVQTAENKPKYIRVAENAIMLSQADTLHQEKTSKFFNQMAGNKLEAWFTDGQIDSLSAQGNAHGIFYSLDAQNKYIGVTQQDSRVLNFYFLNKELQRIVGKSDVVGRVYPMGKVDHEKIRLKGFQWLEDKRPKSKYDLLAH